MREGQGGLRGPRARHARTNKRPEIIIHTTHPAPVSVAWRRLLECVLALGAAPYLRENRLRVTAVTVRVPKLRQRVPLASQSRFREATISGNARRSGISWEAKKRLLLIARQREARVTAVSGHATRSRADNRTARSSPAARCPTSGRSTGREDETAGWCRSRR